MVAKYFMMKNVRMCMVNRGGGKCDGMNIELAQLEVPFILKREQGMISNLNPPAFDSDFG